VEKNYVPAVIMMMIIIAAPKTKIAGEFDVCVLAEGKNENVYRL
jgi:hypothetical protein